MRKSSKWLHPSAFSTKDLYASSFPSPTCYMIRPTHPPLREHLKIMKSLIKRYKYYHQHRTKRVLKSVCPSIPMK